MCKWTELRLSDISSKALSWLCINIHRVSIHNFSGLLLGYRNIVYYSVGQCIFLDTFIWSLENMMGPISYTNSVWTKSWSQTSSHMRNCLFVLNLLVERRKDIVRTMGATSVQVEPVQSSAARNGWGFINLQNTQHENRKKKISQQPSNFLVIINTAVGNHCVQRCRIPPNVSL